MTDLERAWELILQQDRLLEDIDGFLRRGIWKERALSRLLKRIDEVRRKGANDRVQGG